MGEKNEVPVNTATGKRYISNFEGEEIDGRRYTLGEGISAGVDGATMAYLAQNGRVTELGPEDAAITSGGESQDMRLDPADMNRTQLLHELAADMDDESLRRDVAGRREFEASRKTGGGEHGEEGAEAVQLTAEENAEVEKLVKDNDRDGLVKLAPKDAAIKGDTNKTEIATLIVLSRRKA